MGTLPRSVRARRARERDPARGVPAPPPALSVVEGHGTMARPAGPSRGPRRRARDAGASLTEEGEDTTVALELVAEDRGAQAGLVPAGRNSEVEEQAESGAGAAPRRQFTGQGRGRRGLTRGSRHRAQARAIQAGSPRGRPARRGRGARGDLSAALAAETRGGDRIEGSRDSALGERPRARAEFEGPARESCRRRPGRARRQRQGEPRLSPARSPEPGKAWKAPMACAKVPSLPRPLKGARSTRWRRSSVGRATDS